MSKKTGKICRKEKIRYHYNISTIMNMVNIWSNNSIYTYTLEVKPPFFIGWFTNHHYFSRGLSSSKRNHHFFNGGWLPGYIYIYMCMCKPSVFNQPEKPEKPWHLRKLPRFPFPFLISYMSPSSRGSNQCWANKFYLYTHMLSVSLCMVLFTYMNGLKFMVN